MGWICPLPICPYPTTMPPNSKKKSTLFVANNTDYWHLVVRAYEKEANFTAASKPAQLCLHLTFSFLPSKSCDSMFYVTEFNVDRDLS